MHNNNVWQAVDLYSSRSSDPKNVSKHSCPGQELSASFYCDRWILDINKMLLAIVCTKQRDIEPVIEVWFNQVHLRCKHKMNPWTQLIDRSKSSHQKWTRLKWDIIFTAKDQKEKKKVLAVPKGVSTGSAKNTGWCDTTTWAGSTKWASSMVSLTGSGVLCSAPPPRHERNYIKQKEKKEKEKLEDCKMAVNQSQTQTKQKLGITCIVSSNSCNKELF